MLFFVAWMTSGLVSLPLSAQGRAVPVIVRVQVQGAATPVRGARVDIAIDSGHRLEGVTDEKGEWMVSLDPDRFVNMMVAAAGYESFVHREMTLGQSAYIVNLEPGVSQVVMLEPPVQPVANTRWEYGVLVQGGSGLEERTDFSFLMAGAHLGRVLTPELGSGVLKGTFEYAVEVLPLWQSYTPQFQRLNCPAGATVAAQCRQTTTGGTYRGASITPIVLRWNFTHGTRFMPWVQAAGGVLYTTRKYPGVGDLNPTDPTQTGPAADTSVWNFTPQGGVGVHYFPRERRSVDMSLNGVHISSASLGDKNPGVNVALQVSVGYSWWK